MTTSSQQGQELAEIFESWLKYTVGFLGDMGTDPEHMASMTGIKLDFDTQDVGDEADEHSSFRSWEDGLKTMAATLRLMAAPDNQEALLKGLTAYSEAVAHTTGESIEHFLEFQSSALKGLAKMGEHTKAYNIDELDQSAFESYREWYVNEFQKYLYTPKIGLPRELHEKSSTLVDKTHIFQSHLGELLFLFTMPMAKANRIMQKKFKAMLKNGEIPEDSTEMYNQWIRELEEHYMELLKSEEYTKVLNHTITSLVDYRELKTDLMSGVLKQMQIPSNKEMDEVYKDLYQMKKQMRMMGREIERLKNELADKPGT